MRIPAIFIAIFFFILHSAADAEFPAVMGPCNLSFPKDHASHPDYRIEWWYYTGNVRAEDGARYGFQLTFFRIRTVPADKEIEQPGRKSAWRADQVFAAHAALSDISSNEFHHSEKMSRAALNLAGTREDEKGFEVYLNRWKATIAPELHHLSAQSVDFSFDLDLIPEKGPVAHGESGYSRKGEETGEASCYYSITRIQAKGTVRVGGREKLVRGTAWMDHEFSSAPLNPGLAGWDWFSLQFSDGSDLMIYLMRKKSGEYSPVSSGTFVDKDGKPTRILFKDFRISTRDTWKSPHTGAVYPSSWLLEVIPLDLRVSIVPNMADQEMQTPGSTRVTYWEGSIRAEGSRPGDRRITGEGYAEFTGYAGGVFNLSMH